MSHASRTANPGRTRAINTLLALVVAACLGIIFADQSGKFGGAALPGGNTPDSSAQSSGQQHEGQSGVSVPDLAPAGPEQTQTEQSPPPASTAPASPAPTNTGGGYGDIK